MSDSHQYIGIPMGIVQMAMAATFAVGGIASNYPTNSSNGVAPTGYVTYRTNGTTNYGDPAVTYLLQYSNPTISNWCTYDEKYTFVANATSGYGLPNTGTNTNAAVFLYNDNKSFYVDSNNTTWSKNAIGSEWCVLSVDPRTSRFGMLFAGCNGDTNSSYSFPLGAAPGLYATNDAPLYRAGWATPIGTITNNSQMQYAAAQNALLTARPDEYAGMVLSSNTTGPTATNWYPGGSNSILRPGLLAQNNPNITNASGSRFSNDPVAPTFTKQFFADDDGVVRRGMSAFVPLTNSSSSPPASYPSTSSNFPSGTPLLTAYTYDSSGYASATTDTANKTINEYLSRPVILNRPFHSVAELGYVFSGTPWRNLDSSTPESGGAALLDAFCIDDTSDSLGLFAGRVDLNTRQIPVLQAILSGAYKEEFNYNNSLVNSPMTTNLANTMAQALILRTHGTNSSAGPLVNIAELVGKWYSSSAVNGTNFINGSASYVGFADDQTTALTNDISAVLANAALGTDPEIRVQRLRDTTIRALASSGQTRVWNLLIDLIVQPGRYPSSATGFGNFVVDGEIHLWIHLSVDRLTGKILDRRVETLKE